MTRPDGLPDDPGTAGDQGTALPSPAEENPPAEGRLAWVDHRGDRISLPMQKPRILIVDDEELIRWSLKERLEQEEYRIFEAQSGEEARGLYEEAADLVLLDYKLPDADGLTLLREIKDVDPDTLVILMTAYSTVETAVAAMKQGAYHYLDKPFNMDEMVLLVEKALETTRLRREVRALRAGQSGPHSLEHMVGESTQMIDVKGLLLKVAQSPASTVLLTGESGTGKDVAAKVIHYQSNRAHAPFCNITCSALPESLLESEFFGHERGAFTDARQQKKGLLELADGGTVFLDEIGEMTMALQAKLLRFLEEKTFRRVGGSKDIRVDVRIVAATNTDLGAAVEKGGFREDLYYRLNVIPISMPPLRDRRGDTRLLVSFFLDQFNREFRKKVQGISDEALALLEAHSWPGNVRELKNAVERAVLLGENELLGRQDFLVLAPESAGGALKLPVEGVNLEELERDFLVQALARTKGNQTQAAKLLGMNRDQIRYRIAKFELDRTEQEG